MPDGTQISLNKPRFMGPEVLFRPSVLVAEGYEYFEEEVAGSETTMSFPELAASALKDCNTQNDEVMNELLGSVVLTGGETTYVNF